MFIFDLEVVYVKRRVATHLENLEKSENLRVVREKSGKMCSCMWSITENVILDTKYARKEFFTR